MNPDLNQNTAVVAKPSAMRQQPLQSVKGMNDVLPADAGRWESLENILREWLAAYGYKPVRTPVLEPTALFRRGIG